ncbi:hypothetical protein BC940DRAFT_114428 [Gongronella butleri]|nr:hypothetical protein BC940DRAFT_114428 [Gongronella butleri]
MTSDQYSLTVSIQSDSGWSLHGEPVYGPGSIIQGQVHFRVFDESLLQSLDQVRLVFHSTERVIGRESQTILDRRQLFGSQMRLWEGKHSMILDTEYTYPFYIQLPMVQFPPSLDLPIYRCHYTISIFLDEQELSRKPVLNLPIQFLPLLETSQSKSSIYQERDGFGLSTHTLDYVPDDHINLDFLLPSTTSTGSSSMPSHVQVELVQSVSSGGHTIRTAIGSDQVSLSGKGSSLQLRVHIPDDTTPTVSYSDLVTVSYRLVIRVRERRLLGHSYRQIFDLPIHIGTLGYGVRSPQDMQLYSIFRTTFSEDSLDTRPMIPAPSFLRDQESQTDFLPPYDSTRLPSYDYICNLPFSPVPSPSHSSPIVS